MGDTGNKLDHDDKKVKDIQGRVDDMNDQLAKLQGKPGNEKQVAKLQEKLARVNAKLAEAQAEADAD